MFHSPLSLEHLTPSFVFRGEVNGDSSPLGVRSESVTMTSPAPAKGRFDPEVKPLCVLEALGSPERTFKYLDVLSGVMHKPSGMNPMTFTR